ncbi:unnamed protein product [Lupinus luteus]|uniref:Peroxidase n=1 Tax=Lupinus luteus TaxID=3873 RepID=A0AAV1WR28_LUPLU
MAWVSLATLLMFLVVLVQSKPIPTYRGFGNNAFNGNKDFDLPDYQKDFEPEKLNGEQVKNVNGTLREGFYSQSCPNAEKIVADELALIAKTNPNAVPNLLRLQFHDCFVGGCDASILLDVLPSGEEVEKTSLLNGLLLKGTDIIDDIKAKLEQECPQTVSCSDTLAFATNEAISLAGLPRQAPLGGRRDSIVSLAMLAEDNNLPLPNWSVDKMLAIFEKKGFTAEEMVILLGAHSVGSSHCDMFNERLYDFKGTQKPDPALAAPFVDELRKTCTAPGTPQYRNPPVNFDETPTVLDNLFYKNLAEKRRSLLMTDDVLLDDPRTAPTVKKMAAEPELFAKRFPEMMVKLSSLNVLTGNDGEVRIICRSTN